jgi:hypothetical protein
MLHMVRFRGPGLTLERERSTGDELRRSEEKPGGTKSRGWTRRHRRALAGLWFIDEPVGAFDDAPFHPY